MLSLKSCKDVAARRSLDRLFHKAPPNFSIGLFQSQVKTTILLPDIQASADYRDWFLMTDHLPPSELSKDILTVLFVLS